MILDLHYSKIMIFFIFPSKYEGFSNLLFEACLSGIKVLSSNNIDGLNEISKIFNLIEFDINDINNYKERINDYNNTNAVFNNNILLNDELDKFVVSESQKEFVNHFCHD